MSRRESGFTLIETMAALLIFSLITLGIVPLMASSLRSATISRSTNVAKNFTSEALERVRGLPYYVSFASVNQKVDVLDLYFPSASGAAGGVYTTTCPGSAPNPACPPATDIPEGYTLKFKARFVTPNSTVTPQTYSQAPVPSGYVWNSTIADTPPSKLMEITVTATWTLGASDRTFEVTTLVGDRRFSGTRVRGFGRVDYAVQVLTGYRTGGQTSSLSAIAGNAESSIESRLVAVADQSARAAEIRLTAGTTTGNPETDDLGEISGAVSSEHAPPDANPSGNSEGARLLIHPATGTEIGGFDATTTGDIEVGVANELPEATGGFNFSTGGSPLDFWVRSQIDPTSDSPLHLDPTLPMFSINTLGTDTASGTSSAATTPVVGASREVATTARTELFGLRLLPATFINAQARATDPTLPNSVVRVVSFTGEVECSATAGTSASTDVSYTASLTFWFDPTNDGILNGGYVDPPLTLSSEATSDPLAGILTSNPLVFDGATARDDVYLFSDASRGRTGYLASWSSLFNVNGTVSQGGRFTSADLPGAISIDTMPMDPKVAETALNVSVGKLACEAEDLR